MCKSQEHSDCCKHMAKQVKKECCGDKAMGCKSSFHALGTATNSMLLVSASATYSWLQENTDSRTLLPAAQPPQA